MNTKSLGVFKRGKTYWLAWTIAGKRYRESLRTSDEAIAAHLAHTHAHSALLTALSLGVKHISELRDLHSS